MESDCHVEVDFDLVLLRILSFFIGDKSGGYFLYLFNYFILFLRLEVGNSYHSQCGYGKHRRIVTGSDHSYCLE